MVHQADQLAGTPEVTDQIAKGGGEKLLHEVAFGLTRRFRLHSSGGIHFVGIFRTASLLNAVAASSFSLPAMYDPHCHFRYYGRTLMQSKFNDATFPKCII